VVTSILALGSSAFAQNTAALASQLSSPVTGTSKSFSFDRTGSSRPQPKMICGQGVRGSWQYFYYQAHPLPNVYVCYYPGYCPNTSLPSGFAGCVVSELTYGAAGIITAVLPVSTEVSVPGAIVTCGAGGLISYLLTLR
jgi:hypothetical protein